MTPISTQAALLQALIRGPGYGLELIDRIRDTSGGLLFLLEGAIYPALRSMEVEGLVESWQGAAAPERGGRPRRYYRLTAVGEKKATEQRTALSGLLGLEVSHAR